MPELPEVETTLRGVAPHIVGQLIDNLTIHNGSLRWPVTQGISEITRDRELWLLLAGPNTCWWSLSAEP